MTTTPSTSKIATVGDAQSSNAHAWESSKASDANWSNINEDADGNLKTTYLSTSREDLIRQRRKRLKRLDHSQSSRRILRDMIRYMYIVLDLSECMYEKSSLGCGSSRTKLDIMLETVSHFVTEYFDQNPLSHLGLIICKNGEAHILSLLSGSKRAAIVALGAIREGMHLVGGVTVKSSGSSSKNTHEASNATSDFSESTMTMIGGKDTAGVFSLQMCLEVAGRSLGHMPRHGSREMMIIVGSLSTCDPGDVMDTIPRLVGASIRVNCIAMDAEMSICRKLSERTGGVMGVALDGSHFKDLILNFCPPPPKLDDIETEQDHICKFIPMGFPTRITEDVPYMVHSVTSSNTGSGALAFEKKFFFSRTGYACPRCRARISELPADCAVCGLKLVLAPHLARSFHHLFPVSPFVEIEEDVQLIANDDTGASLTGAKTTPTEVKSLPPLVSSSSSQYNLSSSKIDYLDGEVKTIDIDSKLLTSSKDFDRCCFACLKVIGGKMVPPMTNDTKKRKKQNKESSHIAVKEHERLRFQCPECKNVFCGDCDAYLHETLHNCPGCLLR